MEVVLRISRVLLATNGECTFRRTAAPSDKQSTFVALASRWQGGRCRTGDRGFATVAHDAQPSNGVVPRAK